MTKRDAYRLKGLNDVALQKMERKFHDLFSREGIAFTLDGPIGNTMDSHRLAAWTLDRYGAEVQDRFVDAVFQRYFSKGLNPADHSVLVEVALAVGVDVAVAKAVLETNLWRQDVLRSAHKFMTDPMVTGVPHYIFSVDGAQTPDGPEGVSAHIPGAQDVDTFYLTLKAIARKARERLSPAKL
eukprot:TRINITY_DN66544_c0_g1_i1.p1 TRINITY_DN66544_c0_g1~~TRINITY_DN66544_c0_g1_i1.p1  ORF type:complete len:183 (-),score=26.52 TRINITY_DN66544_c0_g1_i1:338-886(-)